MASCLSLPAIWLPKPLGIPPSPPAARRRQQEWERLRAARTFTGRLPASMRECLIYLRGLGGMTGLVSEPGMMEAAFGPMGAGGGGLGSLATKAKWHYAMEEASGDRADSTANALHLTPVNTPGNATGKIDNALALNGSNQYVSHAYDALYNMSATYMTVTCWIYLTDTAFTGRAFAKGDFSTGGLNWQLLINAGAAMSFPFRNAVNTSLSVTATNFGAPPATTWIFVVIKTFDNGGTSTSYIRVNGGTANTRSLEAAGYLQNTEQPFAVGAAVNGASQIGPFKGRIDEVTGFQTTLTPTEENGLYNSGNGVAWPFVGL